MNYRPYFVIVFAAAVALAAASTALGQAATNAALKNPAALKEMAPAQFKVNFDTSAGVFEVEVHRDWAPNGADRFYNLVKNGFFDNARFFRVISGFMVQFGLNGDPGVNAVWREARIPRDPVKDSDGRATLALAAHPAALSLAEGARPGHRSDRIGQINDPLRDDRLRQPASAGSHHHHRGSDRVRPREPEMRHQSA